MPRVNKSEIKKILSLNRAYEIHMPATFPTHSINSKIKIENHRKFKHCHSNMVNLKPSTRHIWKSNKNW